MQSNHNSYQNRRSKKGNASDNGWSTGHRVSVKSSNDGHDGPSDPVSDKASYDRQYAYGWSSVPHGQGHTYQPYPLGNTSHISDDPHLPGHSHSVRECFDHRQHELQHAQRQIEQHRSIQASFQMLFNIYDYTIGMIEELEKHETHGKQVQNSGILSHVIPQNHKKPKPDVIAGIELELKCLQAQVKFLPPEVINAAKKDLVMQTIKWAASREAEGIPYGHVDHYCKNVLEILLFDAHKELPSVDRAPKMKLTSEQVNEAMHQMAIQRHLGDKQDEEFYRDPKKEAKLRKKRQTEDIREGARRLATDSPRLAEALDKLGYVPDASMDLD